MTRRAPDRHPAGTLSGTRLRVRFASTVAAAWLGVTPALHASQLAAPASPAAASAPMPAPQAHAPAVRRCGWFDNPTPGNATLADADGEWTVGQQGGHQADGRWPRFSSNRWVRTGTGSAGYGCACLTVREVPGSHDIAAIVTAQSRPLSACRGDHALKGREPIDPTK